jgi:hypothetical protein
MVGWMGPMALRFLFWLVLTGSLYCRVAAVQSWYVATILEASLLF